MSEREEPRKEALLRASELLKRVKDKRPPTIEAIFDGIIAAWGGAARFAKSFHEEFKSAKPGSNTRARMLESAVRLMQSLQSSKQRERMVDLGMVSDIELASMLYDLVGEEKEEDADGERESGTP